MSKAIVWFKTDLRIHDHEPLVCALEEHEQVLCVYCFDPAHFAQTKWGWPKTGPHRARFLHESVRALGERIESLGGRLTIAHESPVSAISRLVHEVGAQAVYAHAEIADEEKQLESALQNNLQVPLHLYEGNQLVYTHQLPFSVGEIPDVFTRFRKQIEKHVDIYGPLESPTRIPYNDLDAPSCVESMPPLAALGVEPVEKSEKSVLSFSGGESSGLERLEDYVWKTRRISSYKKTRNGLLGANYSSKFSPWLALGCLSPRLIYQEILRYEREVEANDSTYWLFFELLWREYFRWVMQKYTNALFFRGGIRGKPPAFYPDPVMFERWQTGTTGMPFVDANMRELNLTGFMSNRGRQNVASFLVKDLQLDWRKGASYFESMLLDYDVYSNWGNWAYIAGVGNDPREQRYFNVLLQAQKYDKQGRYVRHWVPEISSLPNSLIHVPFADPNKATLRGYPRLEVVPTRWKKFV